MPDHKLSRTDDWRTSALHFKEFGTYTKLTPNPAPNSAYMKFWKEERRRCIEGYHCGWDYIPGYYYFYLNYSPIIKVEPLDKIEGEEELEGSQIRAERVEGFADVWDGDYDYFHYLEEAEKAGKHGAVLKTRGRGYSFKGGSMMNRNFFLIPKSKSYAIASESEFLTKDGILTKAWSNLNFINQHTPWAKHTQVKNTEMHKRASYLINGIEKGYMSEIIGITLKDDPQKARGKRGKLILWEEAGKFPGLLQAWQIARPSIEQGRFTFGLMVAFGTGGCLTAGNKVWNNHGNLVNIEDLNKEDGIIGFKVGEGFSKENIVWEQPTSYKECIYIETNTGRWIECSLDHPIYKRTVGRNGITLGNEFTKAVDLKLDDDIAVIENVDIWSEKKLEHARLIGWLIGDGTYGKNQSARLFNCEKEINDYVYKNYDVKELVTYKTKLNKTYKETRIKGFCAILRSLGIYGQTKTRKTLPKDIHSYSKESVAELIGGLFDTDGYVSFRGNKSRINSYISEVSISQASKSLLLELQLLLQKFGIHSYIRERKPKLNKKGSIKDVNSWYELSIRDKRSLITFYENVKLKPKEKQEKLNKIYNYCKSVKFSGRGEYKGLRYEKVVKIIHTGIKRVYNLEASETHTYIGNGIITHNTEGANFQSLEKLFYKPKAYRVHGIQNRWDEGKQNTECGFFHGEQTNFSGQPQRLYMDKDGNSNEEYTIKEILKEREEMREAGADANSILQHIAEKPICPAEAVLRTSGFYFPVAQLKKQLSEIETNKEKYLDSNWVGTLEFDSELGILQWKDDLNLQPLRDFPSLVEEGAIEIFEKPQADASGRIPFGTYIAGIDPVDKEKTTYTESLGSILIMNRWTRRIVAEYTGRPDNPKTFYETCRRLLMYYNATALYENQLTGIFTYFEHKKSLHLLADTPKQMRDSLLWKENTNASKGMPASERTNSRGREYIKSWLLDPISTNSDILNYQKIKSVGLLKELIAWNQDGNFDRVSALGMLMWYDETLYRPEQEQIRKVKTVLDDPYWKEMGLIRDNDYENKYIRNVW